MTRVGDAPFESNPDKYDNTSEPEIYHEVCHDHDLNPNSASEAADNGNSYREECHGDAPSECNSIPEIYHEDPTCEHIDESGIDAHDHCKRSRLLLLDFEKAANIFVAESCHSDCNDHIDDIEDIIDILLNLQGDEQQLAFEMLPPYLLDEVCARLVSQVYVPTAVATDPGDEARLCEEMSKLEQQDARIVVSHPIPQAA